MDTSALQEPHEAALLERKAELFLILTTLFWAGTFVFTKSALQSCDPFLFVGIRFALAVVISMLIWPGMFRNWSSRIALDGVVMGVCYGLGFVFQTWGLQFTTISKSAFITGMVVVFVPAVDRFIRKAKINMVQALTVIVATIGLVLLTRPDGADINKGDLMTLAGSVMWAICISYLDLSSNARGEHRHYMPILVFVQFLVTAVVGILFYEIASASSSMTSGIANGTIATYDPSSWNATVVVALLYTAVFGSFASTSLQTKYQRYVSPVKAGVIFTLEPVIASFIAYFTHAERLGTQELIGAALMIAAVVLGDVLKERLTS